MWPDENARIKRQKKTFNFSCYVPKVIFLAINYRYNLLLLYRIRSRKTCVKFSLKFKTPCRYVAIIQRFDLSYRHCNGFTLHAYDGTTDGSCTLRHNSLAVLCDYSSISLSSGLGELRNQITGKHGAPKIIYNAISARVHRDVRTNRVSTKYQRCNVSNRPGQSSSHLPKSRYT